MFITQQNFKLFDRSVLERGVFQPPWTKPVKMDNEACFILSLEGQASIFSAQGQTIIEGGESILMKCGHYLNRWTSKGPNQPSEALVVKFYPEIFQQLFSGPIPGLVEEKPDSSRTLVRKFAADQMIASYAKSLKFYFENPSLVTDELILLKVKELVLLLIKLDTGNQVRTIIRDLFNPQEFSLKQVVEYHLFDPLSIEELSGLANVSVPTFKRKFKQFFGESPGRYIRQKRMERARELLKINTDSITEVAFKCGYPDPGHFSKVFRQHVGLSPRQYRQSERANV